MKATLCFDAEVDLAFLQAGTGAVATTVQAKLRRIVDIEDFGGGTGVADNTAALLLALDHLDSVSGGTLQFQAGTYNFASSALGGNGIEVPPNITIQGRGKGTTALVVTGVAVCYFFVNEDNASNHLLRDLTARGNSFATNDGNGSFYYCSVLLDDATASVRNCRLQNVCLENFGGDQWVRFYCTSDTYTIDDCGIDWGCDALTEEGNARNPAVLGVTSAIVEFRAQTDGQINDCFVNGLTGELSWVKNGIAVFGNVNRLKIRSPSLRNVFQGYSNDDVGAYAIVLYDHEGIVTGTTIENPLIPNPYSVGIYTAGSNHTLITSPHIYGQEDTDDGTLPKAAIALNGANNVKITNPDLHDNYMDIAIVGSGADVNGFAYAADMNITVVGGSGIGASNVSVAITASSEPTKAATGGIEFIGYRGTGATDSGVAFNPHASRAIVDVEFRDCDIGGTAYGYNLKRNGAASHESDRIVISGGRASGGNWSIRGLDFNGGSITIENVEFYGTPANHHIQFETMDSLSITGNRFYGAPGAGENMYLEACKGTLRSNVALNGSALVENTAAALGVDAPAWAGYPGVYVQNTVPGLTGTTPNAYRLMGWEWLTGTTWTEVRSGLV